MNNWVTFIGEGRSGHTLASAIIASHPNARVAHELKTISAWDRTRVSREEVIESIFASGIGKERRDMGFEGINTHEEPLMLIGDKCGWDLNGYARKHDVEKTWELLDDFSDNMKMSVKTVLTLRDPIQNISAWVASPKYQRLWGSTSGRRIWSKSCRRYIRFHNRAARLLEGMDNIFVLRNEELIATPSDTIDALRKFLELPEDVEWLKHTSSKVFSKPRRRELEWPENYLTFAQNYIKLSPLHEYYR